jgi:hypothetical protein
MNRRFGAVLGSFIALVVVFTMSSKVSLTGFDGAKPHANLQLDFVFLPTNNTHTTCLIRHRPLLQTTYPDSQPRMTRQKNFSSPSQSAWCIIPTSKSVGQRYWRCRPGLHWVLNPTAIAGGYIYRTLFSGFPFLEFYVKDRANGTRKKE